MARSRRQPKYAAIRYPAAPNTETPEIVGGAFMLQRRDEPTNIAAVITPSTRRLSTGSMWWWSKWTEKVPSRTRLTTSLKSRGKDSTRRSQELYLNQVSLGELIC